MAGYRAVQELHKLEQEVDELGFVMQHPRHSYGKEFGDMVAIVPKGDALPVYSRDAELYVGTLEGLREWLRGVQWARNYDRLLFGARVERRRADKEQNYRNEQLLRILAGRAIKEDNK